MCFIWVQIIAGLWVNPRMPEAIQKSELNDLAQTYGKFWCTWQVDRGNVHTPFHLHKETLIFHRIYIFLSIFILYLI